jgi:Phage integrase family
VASSYFISARPGQRARPKKQRKARWIEDRPPRVAKCSSTSCACLRHTFASRLLESGADIVTVQQLLDHSTVITTLRYAHSFLDSKRAAVEKLEKPDRFGDNLVTMHQNAAKKILPLSQNRPQLAEYARIKNGGVGERLKPAVLKTVRLERVSGVRIPPPPPLKTMQRWS